MKESQAPTPGKKSARTKPQILIVDDERAIRTTLQQFLEIKGYATSGAHGGRQALSLLSGAPNAYALVILDIRMPHLSGLETYPLLREICPELPVILASADPPSVEISSLLKNESILFIQKPYGLQQILRLIVEFLGE
jgi:DNA-binding NtrC family response regulator